MRTTVWAVAALAVMAAGAQDGAVPAVGWYNGDWQSGIPGLLNWYASKHEYARVYDDFVVPDGGWTVVGAFSNNVMYNFPDVTEASWAIRGKMASGKGGKLIASGVSQASVRPASGMRI